MKTYTNTSSPVGVLGLLFLTVAVTYCANHSDEIVADVKNAAIAVERKVENVIYNGKKKYQKITFKNGEPVFGRYYWK